MKSRVFICFSASDTWYGRMIRYLTQSDFNHVFLSYKSDMWGGWWATQVDDDGVRLLPLEKVVGKKKMPVECYETVSSDVFDGLVSVRDYIGSRYDWRGIFGFLVKLIVWRLFGKRILNPFHDRAKMFCSEFVMLILQKANIGNTMNYDASSASPEDVRKFLTHSPIFKRKGEPLGGSDGEG
jgi:hypothetical protein